MAGLETVGIDGQTAYQFNFWDGLALGHEVALAANQLPDTEQLTNPLVRSELTRTRKAIGQLVRSENPSDAQAVMDINTKYGSDTLFEDCPTLQWTPNILGKLARLSNPELLAFCKWNVARLARQQQALDRDIDGLQDGVEQCLQVAIDCGLLPAKSRGYLQRAIAETSIRAIDSFDAGGLPASGYYISNENRMGLANLYYDGGRATMPQLSYPDVVFHEDLHGLGFINNRGFANGLSPRTYQPGLIWLEETFVEHIVRVGSNAHGPRPDSINPSIRSDVTTGTYPELREFLDQIMYDDDDNRVVDASQLGEAFMSERRSNAKVRADVERKLGTVLAKVFPEFSEAPLQHLSEQYDTTRLINRGDIVKGWLQRLYAHRTIAVHEGTIDILDPAVV